MYFKWRKKEAVNPALVEHISASININSFLSKILVQRNVEDYETAKSFFNPLKSELHDPFLMKDMDLAIDVYVNEFHTCIKSEVEKSINKMYWNPKSYLVV